MSLRQCGLGEVPVETARVAWTVCPRGTLAMRLRGEFAEVFSAEEVGKLFPASGRPAVPPGVLMLVTVLQFTEGLSDRQAAEAVRTRIDWKYAMGVELTDTGFDHSVLSDFRARLLEGGMAGEAFERVLVTARGRGLLKPAGRARTDSARVLGAIRAVNQLENLGETLRAALNALAVVAPGWLSAQADPKWFDRYGHRVEDARLPKSQAKRRERAERTGADGMRLLEAVFGPSAPGGLRHLGTVELLRQVWVHHFHVVEGVVRWREEKDLPPGRMRSGSPYDPDTRPGAKRGFAGWTGYAVHLTETCEPDLPNLITYVATTGASVGDVKMTGIIHAALAERDRLPAVHLVDGNYIDGHNLVAARRDWDIELLGPPKGDTTAKAQGQYHQDAFAVDWDNQAVTCPNGKTSVVWRDTTSHRGTPVVRAKFAKRDCSVCPAREQCTSSPHGRWITLRPRDEHEAIRAARAATDTDDWKQRHQARNGIESAISQGVRAFGLRQSRYRGREKIQLQHLFTAAAMNLTRLDAWTNGIPRGGTRTSRFEALRPAA